MDAKEAIPMNAQDPRGKEVDICMFVDSDHAGDKVPRRSRGCFYMYKHDIGAVVLKETIYIKEIIFQL